MGKKNGGFTLVEMLATIVCASIVTLTAMSFLLMCMRLWASAQEDIGRQETERIILTAMESFAEDDAVKNVRTAVDGDVALLGDKTAGGAPVLLYFDASGNTICTGGSYDSVAETCSGGSVLMEDVQGFEAELNGGLLTFTLKMSEDEVFSTSVYCRTGDVASTATAENIKNILNSKKSSFTTGSNQTEIDARFDMLYALLGQIGSTGEIRGASAGDPQYFSQWYQNGTYSGGWDENTPWCACFVSWGIEQVKDNLDYTTPPKFANVKEGMEGFQGTGGSSGNYGEWITRAETIDTPPLKGIIPGDLIFFDWKNDTDPDHVGVVLFTENGRVYTIEGNSGSKGRAAVRSYDMDDACILGYGRLKWNT